MGRGGDGERRHIHFPTLSPHFFFPSLAPLVQISFSPKPSAAVKIKDSSYDFHKGNTERSPVKLYACSEGCRSLGSNSQLVQVAPHSARNRVLLWKVNFFL